MIADCSLYEKHVSLDTPDLSLSPPIPTESESTVVDLQVARGQRIHQGDTLGFIETSYVSLSFVPTDGCTTS